MKCLQNGIHRLRQLIRLGVTVVRRFYPLAAAALCAVFLGSNIASAHSDARKILLDAYGLNLVDTGGAGDWQPSEMKTAVELLTSLPPLLSTVAKRTPAKTIRLVKSYAAPRSIGTHLTPWVINLQIIVFLQDASHLTGKIAGGRLSADEQAQYDLYFRRKLVHHLLHLYDAERQISHSAAWRNISGWRYREYFGIRLPFVREALNQDPRNYTREDGMAGPEEDFATFGEFFFVDVDDRPETSVGCRIPDKYQFFRDQFPDFTPFAQQIRHTCPSPEKNFFDDITFLDPITRRPVDMGQLSSDNVEGFELLYATPGVNDAAEIAGHLILRVRLRNNPEAVRLGIENPNDLVISFLADTEPSPADGGGNGKRADAVTQECRETWFDFGQAVRKEHDAMRSIIQALKGLSGGFLTVYDRQTLYQAVKTYTIDQDRNLLRYELRLTDDQKRGLIRRLYVAKQNFKSKYYFFDRNCASILMQVIGEGIGDREVAEFDPFVVPPNSLVALLIRKGLAVQKFPSFYSYRKKGYIAQEEIKARVTSLFKADGGDPAAFLASDESDRMRAWKSLYDHIGQTDQKVQQQFYQLASLGQDAELSWLDRTQRCENYTSRVSQFLRQTQKDLLKIHGTKVAEESVDTNTFINEKYRGEESLDARTGSQNTQLSSVGSGAAWDGGRAGYFFNYAIHKQEAGSVASQAMQRGTSVRLGEARFDHFRTSEQFTDKGYFSWQLTALEIRKFKERLYEVPSYFAEHGKIGLGLSLLKLRKDSRYDQVHSTVGGGAILFNLISSRLYLDYLFLSVGADADVLWRTSRTLKLVPQQTAIVLPVRAEGLLTFGASRLWQLRASHQYRLKIVAGQDCSENLSQISVQYRLPERLISEILIFAQADRLQSFPDLFPQDSEQTRFSLGVEWNRW